MYENKKSLSATMKLPAIMLENLKTYFGEDGLEWASDFDKHLQLISEQWQLQVHAPFPNLSINFVAPVTQKNGEPAVLKLGMPNPDFHGECYALRHFSGAGAVRTLKERS